MNDKYKHFLCGYFLSLMGLFWTPLVCLGFIAGAGKELLDYLTGKGTPEADDMIYTWAGSGVACLVVIIYILCGCETS